jgi:hypothetical protein
LEGEEWRDEDTPLDGWRSRLDWRDRSINLAGESTIPPKKLSDCLNCIFDVIEVI